MKERNIRNLKFRPLRYPEYFEYWKLAKRNPWTVFELDFLNDQQDWKNNLIDVEKNAITRSFSGFTQAEQVIGEYWTTNIPKLTDVPEILMMAREFGAQEGNHLHAYNYQEEIFDLDTFEDFIQNEVAVKKIQTLLDDNSDPITSLAIFSGAAEGCSLFAIFALLCSFCGSNKMKTMKEILQWSAVDEELHSEAGIKLFHLFKDEYGYDEEKIYQGFDLIIQNEIDFIRYVMDNKDLPTMRMYHLINYVLLRANEKLMALGLEPKYELDPVWEEGAREINREMILLTKGKTHGDFFAGKLSEAYTAVVTQNYTQLDYKNKHSVFEDYVRLSV